ncbi:MAG TPA: cyclic nucleotide-binding domain-containing protein [Ignavibacteriaceae bacterium]|nr:cyclic nucleotide-binding domain-containing protein [Ignavibacteriaceae bacterium]
MHRLKRFLQQKFQLPEKDWEMIKEYFQLQFFKKNEYFVREGKICRKLAFIAEGVMRYCMFREDGTDITCFFSYENDFAGDPESFFSQKPSNKNMQALTDCALITLSYENMQIILQQYPQVKEIFAAIDNLVMTKLLNQRTSNLNTDADSRYREFMKEYPHILQRVPQKYIASFLGITEQSLSRLRKNI